MKLLLDTCIPEAICDELLHAGHDVDWTGAWEEDPGDEEILRIAYTEERVLVTLDKDFGDLAVRFGLHHHGIILLRELRIREQADRCIEALEKYGDELQQGAIVVVQQNKMRCRKTSPRLLH